MIPDPLSDEFKSTITRGGYNLLLGSGISLDSRNGEGALLPSVAELTESLRSLKSVGANVQLHRVAGLLSAEERNHYILRPYSSCAAGPSLHPLPSFLWRRAFTFNIDDVVENLYETSAVKQQRLVSLNFTAPFEPTPTREELHLVHLHGSVRQPHDGVVFSHAEYARVMKGQLPWMHLLAQILATEPFIISGTSLNEIDLEYYLSFRSTVTPRRGRGPSLYVEPYPDALTEADCSKYGLTLVRANFGEFLAWLKGCIPTPPTLAQLIVPDTGKLFSGVSQRTQLRFFSDFRAVTGGERPRSTTPSPFLYGGEPESEDLQQHRDIPRAETTAIKVEVERMCREDGHATRILFVLDEPGTGKTTTIRRVAHDLVSSGQPVLSLKTVTKFDTEAAIACLSHASSPVVILVDGFADHVEQFSELLADADTSKNVVVLCAERTYREYIIASNVSSTSMRKYPLRALDAEALRQLVEQYRQFGLVGDHKALKNPEQYARLLAGDPIAIAICRILNDFRPLDAICGSLWDASSTEQRLAYTCTALSEFCHPPGLRYSVLRQIVGQHMNLDAMFTPTVPLGLADNKDESDYVLPLNAAVGDQLVRRVAAKDGEFLLRCFLAIADGIAPQVNRRAIMARTPEARLAGRLFDSDKVVKPLLRNRAAAFYSAAQPAWEWNSRYWEQRALLIADTDLTGAVQHARHAVAIERGSYALTTLGKLLMLQSQSDAGNRKALFGEAFRCLQDAIEVAHVKSRLSMHPFHAMLNGVSHYVENGSKLSPQQLYEVQRYIGEAEYYFSGSVMIATAIERLRRQM